MRWVVEVARGAAAVVVVVVVAAVVAGRAGWAAGSPPGRAEIASAPSVGIGSRTRSANLVTRKSAPSAAHR